MKKDEMNITGKLIEIFSTQEIRPVFDPSAFEILPTKEGSTCKGFYIARWDEFKAHYGLDTKMKGNGYMVAGLDGVLYLVPDWKSLEFKLKNFQTGDPVTINVTGLEVLKDGESTFVKTAVFASNK